jgi:hypothetical protein
VIKHEGDVSRLGVNLMILEIFSPEKICENIGVFG